MKPLIHEHRLVANVEASPFSKKVGQHAWTAIILAGERPEGDPLAEHCNVPYKALIKLDGKSMLAYVAEALLTSSHIGKIVIMAQDPKALITDEILSLVKEGRIEFVESNDGIATSVDSIAGTEIAPWPVLVTTADNALLTPEIVGSFLNGHDDQDVTVGVVARDTVLAAYPQTQRTWLKFRCGAYSGANLFALHSDASRSALTLWSSVEQDRKKSWKIFAKFGPWLMLRSISRTIGFKDAMSAAGDRLSLRAQPVEIAIAEAAIDVDKPDDLELVDEILIQRNLVTT